MKISMVIPVYNALEDVKKCLQSVREHFDFADGEVILVDDCSKPETGDWLKAQAAENPDKFTLLRNAENSGFPKTCNNGIEKAKGEIVVLLNSDTMIPARFCEKIAACFDSDPLIAVASPIAAYSGSYFIPLRDGETVASMNEKIERLHEPTYPAIPTAEGFCLCLRKSALDKFGALDEIYGKGFNEERDLSFRMAAKGLRCVLIDNLYVYHKRHASFGSAERKKQLERNDKIFKERWGNLVKREKDFTKHRNPIDALRRQIQPQYFQKGLFWSKSVLPDKTVWRVFGVKITKKHTGGGAIEIFGTTFAFRSPFCFAKAAVTRENVFDLPSAFKNLNFILPETDIVSFDIFDTAVIRLLKSPKDLFKIVERQSGVPFFYKNRCLAARRARLENADKGIDEITLDEIYDRLRVIDTSVDADTAERLKQMENVLEIRLCRRNKEIGRLFDALQKQGKKICFTTDMYLPRDTIEKILKNCGYDRYDALYLSGEDKLSKKSGQRFKYCQNPDCILHIGDNEKSDFIQAVKHGINAVRYRKSKNAFLSQRLVKNIKKSKNVYLSFSCRLAEQYDFKSYWFSIGYQYAGPLLTCFCLWLKRETEKSRPDSLCFLARDGMIMRRVWQTMFPANETTYLYCSRFLTKQTDCEKTYTDYLKSNLSGHTAVVDVGRKGTIQDNLEKLLPETTTDGYYVDLRASAFNKHGFCTNGMKKNRRFWDFLDFLFIAPAPLCVGIEKQAESFTPVYLPVDTDEKKRHEIAAEIHKGAVSFARDANVFSDILPPECSPDNLSDTLKCLLDFSKKERCWLENVMIPFGMKNEKQRCLISPHFSIGEIIKNPVRCFRIWRKSVVKRF